MSCSNQQTKNKVKVVKIAKTKVAVIVGSIFLLLLMTAAAAFAVEYESLNEIRSRGIAEDVSYDCGYTNGYDDQKDNKPSAPLSILQKYKRVNTDDPDYFCSGMAYLYKGSYVTGYKIGYVDSHDKKEREVSTDFMTEYGIIKESSITESNIVTYTKWNLDELDTSQGIENLAYQIGYTDASKGNPKAPLKIMSDLAKDESRSVRDVYEWILENRGTFIAKYKEGYEYYLNEQKPTKTTETTSKQTSTLPSQLSGTEQKKNAYDTGYKFGYSDALDGKASNPQTILNYDWILNARYDDTGKYQSNFWYKLPTGIEKSDVQKAHADKASYIKGYRAGYEIGVREKNGKRTTELTDAQYIYQIGYDVGAADAAAGKRSNPYTYTWKSSRYTTTTQELDYAKLIRYQRGYYIKGYKDGYANG
ncbi:hypothetical protein HZA99_00380 [Candidatus Woesearchaeota archaeon]|nr:hypothetical protein [Candidatus Woesearchaeota archaeon]